MPFKGDENMLVDAKDRATLDADEGENQLLIGFGDEPKKKDEEPSQPASSGGLLDLDMMMGGGTTNPAPA